jgi:hypothetical protein
MAGELLRGFLERAPQNGKQTPGRQHRVLRSLGLGLITGAADDEGGSV